MTTLLGLLIASYVHICIYVCMHMRVFVYVLLLSLHRFHADFLCSINVWGLVFPPTVDICCLALCFALFVSYFVFNFLLLLFTCLLSLSVAVACWLLFVVSCRLAAGCWLFRWQCAHKHKTHTRIIYMRFVSVCICAPPLLLLCLLGYIQFYLYLYIHICSYVSAVIC